MKKGVCSVCQQVVDVYTAAYDEDVPVDIVLVEDPDDVNTWHLYLHDNQARVICEGSHTVPQAVYDVK